MDEEEMWKSFCRQKSQEVPDTSHDLRIQELDNGFFEKFGTLLQDNVEEVQTEDLRARFASDDEEDKEIEGEEKDEIISNFVGLNIEELYTEVLYEIMHTVGADSECNDKPALLQYLKEAFKMDEEKHEEAYNLAKNKEAPNILLNVEVIQAKDLYPKDANGLSDPFVTLYLSKNTSHRYNTSVKTETLSPCWEEYFSLPAEDTCDDILTVEVWDFDPAETVREKMTKITGIKGVRGLRKLMKEIAVTASTGKHDNEMIGFVNIPLKSIPASGHVKWYNLEKKTSRSRCRGAIQLKLAFSSEKNNQVAAQEHRNLMRLIVLQEMEQNKPDLTEWDGTFQGPADIILRQHATQSGLRPADEKMAQWVEFVRLHTSQPLNFKLFSSIVSAVVEPLSNGLYSDDEIKLFWDATKRLLPSLFHVIRRLRKSPADNASILQLDSVLSILSELAKLNPGENIDLFPKTVFGWLNNDTSSTDVLGYINEAVKRSAVEWFEHVVDINKPSDKSDEERLQQAIKATQQMRGDLQKSIESYDKVFYTRLKIQYACNSYRVYDEKLCEMAEPLVEDICSSLKPIKFKGNIPDIKNAENEPHAMGTSLFELYLTLQRCLVLGQGLFPGDSGDIKLTRFHLWFHRGVAHWLDIAVFKALQRTEKAVELDQLIPVDSMSKHSSSAIDTLSIFYQIQIFWKQLAWPDVEGCYTFVAKIIDDICRCSVFYADVMGCKVEKNGETESSLGKRFEVTQEWCLAINNIDYVRQSIKPLVTELGVDHIVESLSEFSNESAANHCKETLTRVVDNSIDTVKNKIIDLLEMVANKMAPSIKRFLQEGAEIINQENNYMERLMHYLDDNLVTLNSNLNAENFDKILSILWDIVYTILVDVMKDSLEKRRPPAHFLNLDSTLSVLVGFFKQSENVESVDSYKHIRKLLKLHGMSTDDLILHYYQDRLTAQKNENGPSHGLLTVRMQLVQTTLRVEILNARNLLPHDSGGSCDPFVKVNFIPEDKFNNLGKTKTKIQKKNLFPLFDETFTFQLTKDQLEMKTAMMQFVVKDQDFLGVSSQFVAEAFVPFEDIPRTTLETSLHEMGQVHLKLTKPIHLDTDVVKAIEHRHGEKLARDFIKRQKVKAQSNNNNIH